MTLLNIKVWTSLFVLSLLLPVGGFTSAPYPVDGYETTGIRRLLRIQRIVEGKIPGSPPIEGAMLSINDIHLNLTDSDRSLYNLPAPDPEFTKKINAIFPSLDASYSIAVLDITPGKPVRYAERKGITGYQPGSVGKLAVALGFFTEISRIYPYSFAERQELMRTRFVKGGKWAMTDSHTVPFYFPETGEFYKRTVREEDVFSLYEWLDHMMSVSNNGAASIVWRESMLMRAFGTEYPTLTQEAADNFFKTTPKAELSELARSVVNDPIRDLGISDEEWKLGILFTRGASSIVQGKGGSIGSTRGLMKFLMLMESGLVVDPESSLEIKRLMYMTDRRIRYAAAPAFSKSAVYFKSGSLYSCQAEEGFTCIQYQGNKFNYMNSVAIVEHPDGATYLVVLMSNVLRKNSASDHMYLASSVDKAVRAS